MSRCGPAARPTRGGEATVGELADALAASEQNVSKHLAMLAQAGISVAAARATTSTTASSTRASSASARTSAASSGQLRAFNELVGLDDRLMLELWQTEWCPASRRVRERRPNWVSTTSRGRCRSSARSARALRQATGSDTIPTLVLPDGAVVTGEDAILRHFDDHIEEPPEAKGHRSKAAKARRRYLEEECNALRHSYTLSETTTLPFPDAVERVGTEFKAEGFGVLCEIDVQATLKEKLGIDESPI